MRRIKLLAVDESFHRMFKMKAGAKGLSVLKFSEQLARDNDKLKSTVPTEWRFRL
jgi:hypothetical protein